MPKPLSTGLAAALTSLALTPTLGAQQPARTYIVVFTPDAPDVPAFAQALARRHGGRLDFVYEHALRGFSAELSPRAAAALAHHPAIAFVEEDAPVSLHGQRVPTGIQRIFARANPTIPLGWGEEHIVDVDVAVLDTGVDRQHPDLTVFAGTDCTHPVRMTCAGDGDDDHQHGTHVAGTIAARDNGFGVVGVAPGARIWAVKVLDRHGHGSIATLLAGLDWITRHADAIEVANISLGAATKSAAIDQAIEKAVQAGIAFAVSAGNLDDDAADYSPARSPHVLTVSALADFDGRPGGEAPEGCRRDHDDTLADFSNWGPAVDLAAPGTCILSTLPVERGGYGLATGTSMAAPHVAGALALLASRKNPESAADVLALYATIKRAGNLSYT
ncbi:MAG TPA: S8 family serine peptidase, partial [Nannocystis sp.]